MNVKYLLKYCIYVLTTFSMLNFVGYTLSSQFVQQEKSSIINFGDDEAENGKESKEELKNLFIHSRFKLHLVTFESTSKQGIIPTYIKLPIWHELPETPPPDVTA